MTNTFDVIVSHEGKKLGALREYRDKSELAAQIKQDLLTKYFPGDSENKEGFFLGYREEYVGLLSQCYGATSLLLLLTSFGTTMNDAEKAIIIRTVEYVLDHVEEHGYDIDPFIETKKTEDIFTSKEYRYTDSLSWVLTLITQTRYAFVNEKLVISDELNQRLAENARGILRFYIETVIGGEGNPQGWGYVNGCEEPSIYFTYAVTECFNDFEDYIMGNEAINTPEDKEFLKQLNQGLPAGEELHKRLSKIKIQLGMNYWDKFKDVLHTDFLSDMGSVIKRDQIRTSTRTSALFTNVYLICILIYCETDKYLSSDQEKDRLLIIARQALQMVSSYYDVLKSDGLDNIVDRHIISFEQNHPEKKKLNKIFSSSSIYSTTLTPMLIKANSLLTFYVTQFPEREMSRYFDMAIEKRINDGEQWLWEGSKYELATTQRYIEAILDFYDYYENFEKAYLRSKLEVAEEEIKIEQRLRDELTPILRTEVEAELQSDHARELENLKQEITSQYQIEGLIDEKIEKAIQSKTLEILKSAFSSIVSVNKTPQLMEEETSELAATFMSAIRSYFYKYTYEARKIDDKAFETKDELLEKFNEDFEEFIQAWFSYIVTHKGKHGMRWFFDNMERDDSKYLLNPDNK